MVTSTQSVPPNYHPHRTRAKGAEVGSVLICAFYGYFFYTKSQILSKTFSFLRDGTICL